MEKRIAMVVMYHLSKTIPGDYAIRNHLDSVNILKVKTVVLACCCHFCIYTPKRCPFVTWSLI